MPNNSLKKRQRTPVEERKGIEITDDIRELYEKRNLELDKDPDAAPLPPDRWAHAMRRDEYFRPVKKQLTVRIDADVIAWLRSQGDGYLTRINDILRREMLSGRR